MEERITAIKHLEYRLRAHLSSMPIRTIIKIWKMYVMDGVRLFHWETLRGVTPAFQSLVSRLIVRLLRKDYTPSLQIAISD